MSQTATLRVCKWPCADRDLNAIFFSAGWIQYYRMFLNENALEKTCNQLFGFSFTVKRSSMFQDVPVKRKILKFSGCFSLHEKNFFPAKNHFRDICEGAWAPLQRLSLKIGLLLSGPVMILEPN